MGWLGATAGSDEEQTDIAWRSAVAGAVLVILAELAFGAIGIQLFGVTDVFLFRVAHVGIAVLTLIVLRLRRRTTTVQDGVVAFFVLTLPLFPLFWVAEAEMLARGLPWAPFVGHKLVIVGLAVLMPGPPVFAMILIGAISLQVVTQYYAFGIAEPASFISAGEPWVTLVYAGVGVFLVAFRYHHRQIARQAARARAQAEALGEIARFLLALRDMANTPIQALEIDTAILERRHPESAEALKRMRQEVGQLREMSRILARYDAAARWDPGEESFDAPSAMQWLARMQEDLG